MTHKTFQQFMHNLFFFAPLASGAMRHRWQAVTDRLKGGQACDSTRAHIGKIKIKPPPKLLNLHAESRVTIWKILEKGTTKAH